MTKKIECLKHLIKNNIKYLYIFIIVFLSLLMIFFSTKIMTVPSNSKNVKENNDVVVLKSGDMLEQRVNLKQRHLTSFKIQYRGEFSLENVAFSIKDDHNKKINYDKSIDEGSKTISLVFNNVYPEISDTFNVKITNVSKNIQESIEILGDKSEKVDCTLNGKKSNVNIGLDVEGYNNVYHIKYIVGIYVLFLICTILLVLSRNDKTNVSKIIDKIMNKFEKLKLLFVIEFLIFGICVFDGFVLMNDYLYRQDINLIFLILFIFFSFIFIIYAFLLFNRCKNDYARLFVFFAIPICLLFWMFLLPDYTPDEPAHFMKVYLTSTFDFANKNVINVPIDYLEKGITNYNDVFSNVFKFTDYSNTKVTDIAVAYNAISYIIPSIGMLFARIFSFSIYAGYYLARLANIILFIGIGYKAIKITPVAKLLFFVFLFNPMLLQQAISVNADCLLHGSCILFVAYILYLKFEVTELSNKNLFCLGMFFLYILLAKYVYLPLFGLVFIIWDKILKLERKKISIFIIFCILSFIIYYLFNFTFSNVTSVAHVQKYLEATNVNASKQIGMLIDNPIKIITVILVTIKTLGFYFIETFAGNLLGWLDIEINTKIVWIYLMLLFMACFVKNESNKFKLSNKIWFLLIFCGISCLIIIGLYFSFTPVGLPYAVGIQGRYFIPISLLPLLVISGSKKIVLNHEKALFLTGIVFINGFVILKLISYFSYL